MKTYKIVIDYDDSMTAINLIEDLDKILKEYGIRLEIEDKETDEGDTCILTVNEGYFFDGRWDPSA